MLTSLTIVDLLSLAPPFIAIAVAILTRRVVPALGLGAVVAAIVAARGEPADGALRLVSYAQQSVWSLDHTKVSLFSLAVAATVGVMGAAGGTRAMVARVERLATGRRGAMVTSWLAGAIVFFDDYANCLVVGSSMGPLYDRHRVSRAKLAYIVDSTAAPIASLAFISTWAGYEIGLISAALTAADLPASGAFSLFVSAIPYGFYGVFTLVFVGAIAISGRDFGPMLAAESAAARPDAPAAVTDAHLAPATHPVFAVLPIALLIGGTFGWLLVEGSVRTSDGSSASVIDVIGAADPFSAMLFGATSALVVALLMALTAGVATAGALARAMWANARAVSEALVVLYLAWALAAGVQDTGAADVVSALLQGTLPPAWLPATVFVAAALTAFATGTSFGTMGILVPIVVPLALELTGGVDGPIALAALAAVMAGAVLGDHASPISDTTVLSALGAGVDLLTHVRTQLPYALTTGSVALLAGYIPVGFGVPVWLSLPTGALACVLIVRLAGRSPSTRSAL